MPVMGMAGWVGSVTTPQWSNTSTVGAETWREGEGGGRGGNDGEAATRVVEERV